MIAEKSLACWIAASSGATILAAAQTLTQQDAIAWVGILTTAGLAALNLYQKLREIRRNQDAEDAKSTAKSDRAKAALLAQENTRLRDQLTQKEAEAQRWLNLYQSAADRPHATGQTP